MSKQFWLTDNLMTNNLGLSPWEEKPAIESIHVIEYSAYEKLRHALQRLTEETERYAEEGLIENYTQDRFAPDLSDRVDLAKEALRG